MISTDEMWQILEENPGDDFTKLALADMYEEGGEEGVAYALRWCVQNKKWPGYTMNVYGGNSYAWGQATGVTFHKSCRLGFKLWDYFVLIKGFDIFTRLDYRIFKLSEALKLYEKEYGRSETHLESNTR